MLRRADASPQRPTPPVHLDRHSGEVQRVNAHAAWERRGDTCARRSLLELL